METLFISVKDMMICFIIVTLSIQVTQVKYGCEWNWEAYNIIRSQNRIILQLYQQWFDEASLDMQFSLGTLDSKDSS